MTESCCKITTGYNMSSVWEKMMWFGQLSVGLFTLLVFVYPILINHWADAGWMCHKSMIGSTEQLQGSQTAKDTLCWHCEFDCWGLYWVSFKVLKALEQPIWIDFIQNKNTIKNNIWLPPALSQLEQTTQ